jgi:hypothetical protein
MKPEFWQAFDVLVVSAYPGKLTDADIAWIRAKAADEGVQFELKDERKYPNFSQLLTTKTAPAQAAQRFDACWFKTFSRVLDRGYFYRCCTSPYIPRLLLDRPDGTDGLKVEGVTEAKVREFLTQKETPESCSVCAGRNTAEAVAIPWSEIRDAKAWLTASGGQA